MKSTRVLEWWASLRLLRGAVRFGPLDLEDVASAILKSVDIDALEALQARYAPVFQRDHKHPAKFVRFHHWLRVNIARCARMGLHLAPPQRVLDLGCGGGYFLAACHHFGHQAVGIDQPAPGMSETERIVFAELLHILGGVRREIQIIPQTPIAVDETYDRITGFMVCFNGHGNTYEWSHLDWRFFIDDCLLHLAPGGSLWLELNKNRSRYGRRRGWCDGLTLQQFRMAGSVRRGCVVVQSPLDRPRDRLDLVVCVMQMISYPGAHALS